MFVINGSRGTRRWWISGRVFSIIMKQAPVSNGDRSRNRRSNLLHQSQYPLTCWNSEMMAMIAAMVVMLRSMTINCDSLDNPVARILSKIQGSASDRRAGTPRTAAATICVSQLCEICALVSFTSESSEVIVRSIFYSRRRLPLVSD